jgi:hypothetical protein
MGHLDLQSSNRSVISFIEILSLNFSGPSFSSFIPSCSSLEKVSDSLVTLVLDERFYRIVFK